MRLGAGDLCPASRPIRGGERILLFRSISGSRVRPAASGFAPPACRCRERVRYAGADTDRDAAACGSGFQPGETAR